MGTRPHRESLAKRALIARAQDSVGRTPDNGTNFYNAACVYSLSIPAAGQQALAERYAVRAIEFLQQARKVGFFDNSSNLGLIQRDSDLNSLRSRDDFKALLAELKATSSP